MASYVLDTHALLFALSAPKRLGRRARAALKRVDDGKDDAWIPAAVAAEIVMLKELGRTDIGLPELAETIELAPRWRLLALDLAQLDQFAALTAIRDPFDRLVVSATRDRKAKLLSRDAALTELGLVPVVWD